MPEPRELLHENDPAAALAALQRQVRARPDDAKLRVFLFQLLAVLGQWTRAAEQLRLCGELDPSALAMVAAYAPALQSEPVREAVFAGRAAPQLFGEPAPWAAELAQALQLDARGDPRAAAAARAAAVESAPAHAGRLDGMPFGWIADADSRLGPLLEVIVHGRYGWLPFDGLSALEIEPVSDLRDLVWAPARLWLRGGGDAVALIPVRYAGSTDGGDGALALARRTDWLALGEGQYRGLGQRVLVTDGAEHGLLELRRIEFDTPAAP